MFDNLNYAYTYTHPYYPICSPSSLSSSVTVTLYHVGETHHFKGDNIDIWCEAIQERVNWAQKKKTSGSGGGHSRGG